jgi:cytochrome P450
MIPPPTLCSFAFWKCAVIRIQFKSLNTFAHLINCFQSVIIKLLNHSRAREEIDNVLGERTNVSYQDIVNLKYCTSLFKETLRLYSPAPSLSRSNTEEITINDLKIPAESILMLSSYVTGRTEKYFKQASEFKPERFMRETENS